MKELLDVRRRMIYIESLCNFISDKNFPECQRYRMPLLLRQLMDDLELMKLELKALEAVL